MTLCTFR